MEERTETEVTAPAAAAPKGYLENLDEVLATSKSRTPGGIQIRTDVGYTLVQAKLFKLAGQSIPLQKKLMLTIINVAIAEEPHVVSEPELFELVKAAAADGRLTTRQEPWYIFRYYRKSLIDAGVLKEVKLPAKS